MLIKAVQAAHLDAASYRRMLDGLVERKDPCTANQLQALPRSVWISDENRGGCRGDPHVGGVSSAYDWFSGSEARTALCP